jgi:hypothetical protein
LEWTGRLLKKLPTLDKYTEKKTRMSHKKKRFKEGRLRPKIIEDAGDAEEIQESAESDFATAFQGI